MHGLATLSFKLAAGRNFDPAEIADRNENRLRITQLTLVLH